MLKPISHPLFPTLEMTPLPLSQAETPRETHARRSWKGNEVTALRPELVPAVVHSYELCPAPRNALVQLVGKEVPLHLLGVLGPQN